MLPGSTGRVGIKNILRIFLVIPFFLVGTGVYEGVSKQNRKSKMKVDMKENRTLIGAGFKHVPLLFFSCEKSKISNLLPKAFAKIKKLSAENRRAYRKHEQQQFSVFHLGVDFFCWQNLSILGVFWPF